MYCPFCDGEGEVYKGKIKKNQQNIYICSECDTVWLEEDFSKDKSLRFDDIMKNLDLEPLWLELEDLKRL